MMQAAVSACLARGGGGALLSYYTSEKIFLWMTMVEAGETVIFYLAQKSRSVDRYQVGRYLTVVLIEKNICIEEKRAPIIGLIQQ